MPKNLLMWATHDSFWVNVYQELTRLIDAKVKVWVGKEGDISQDDKSYIFYDPYELFHLKGMTLTGEYTRINPKNIDILDYYNFLKILDRVDVGSKLSFSERNHLFFSHLNFWLDLLYKNSIDVVIFSNIPHTPDSYGLMISAKMLNLSIVSVNVTPLPGIVYLTDEYIGNILPSHSSEKEIDENYKLLDEYRYKFGPKYNSELWYMKRQREKEVESNIKNVRKLFRMKFLFRPRTLLRNALPNNGGKKYRSIKRHEGVYDGKQKSILKELLVHVRWKCYRAQLKRESKFCETSEVPEYFLYFPLHFQPEATTAPGAGFFSDQQVLVDLISSCLPKGVFLVLKEHPTQLYKTNWGVSGRTPGYWKKITRNTNVILIDGETNSKELINKSMGVVTGTGTAGYEAIMQGKSSLVFGNPWYLCHPRAIQTDFSTVETAVKSMIEFRSKQSEEWSEKEDKEFIDRMSRLLIRCDVQGQTKGVVERNPERMASAISKHVK